MHHRHRLQRGSSLIEAMVAILVLSISALGYAAQQLQGISQNSSALWRTKATQLAYEMADRLRANQGGVAAGSFNLPATSVARTAVVGGEGAACGSTTPCSPTAMAALDYAQWQADVAGSMPGGTGVICLTSTPDTGTAANPDCDGLGTTFAIKVFWTEKTTPSLFSTVVRP